MNHKTLSIGIPLFIVLLVIGVSALLFKSRYDRTVEIREKENAARDAARAGTIFPTEGMEIPMKSNEEVPVEQSIALSVISPSNGTEATNPSITVRGKTVPYGEVSVNEKEVTAGSDGIFQTPYTLDEGRNMLLVVASDADGNVSEEEMTVSYDSEETSMGALNAVFDRVTLTSKGTGSIVITTPEGKNVTVTVAPTTLLHRRYWGNSSLGEFQAGDIVNVYGKWTDDAKTSVTARLIRDWSGQKRNGIFFGKVLSVTDKGWTVDTKRGNMTVISGNTQIVNKEGLGIAKTDVLVGHTVRVKGMWDRSMNSMSDVSQIKDYSLPPKTVAAPPKDR